MVLGKRTRASADPVLASPRAKKQARTEIFDDAHENPFISQTAISKSAVGVSNATGQRRNLRKDAREVPSSFKSASKERSSRSFRVAKESLESPQDENCEPIQILTPQTPRYRDALSKKVPVTPRHRVLVASKPITPRTPRTPITPGGLIATVYSKARQVFARSNEPGRLVGRDAERDELHAFIHQHISSASGQCIYVSGPPGTGKSAMVNQVTTAFEESSVLKKAYINCMSIKTSKDLYGSLVNYFCEDLESTEGEDSKVLESIFVPRRASTTTYMVTLDEIDHILTLDLEILYRLFEWSLQACSRLILVGIANALDLTDRFLPRLKARNLKPQLLPFLPYNAAQIKNVITSRLQSLLPTDSSNPNYVPFLHPGAIELCSRKIASQTGDLRKAFDICRRAIDLVEAETKLKHEQALLESEDASTPTKRPLEEISNFAAAPFRDGKSLAQSLANLTVETAPRALISHLNKVTSATLSASNSSRLKTLNLQQKAALCALVALEKSKRNAVANLIPLTPSKSRVEAPTIKQLYSIYCMLCKKDSILHPLTGTEFRDVVGSLETMGLISGVDARGTAGKRAKKFGAGVGIGDEKRVVSCAGEKEVAAAVEGLGAGILKSILSGEGLD